MIRTVFRKALSLVVLLIMLTSVIEPVKSKALDDEYGVAVGDITAGSRTWRSLYGDSVRYDASTHTLYLTDANISGFSGIIFGKCEADESLPFTIVLSGDNYIKNPSASKNPNYGIRSKHFSSAPDLVICGKGSLTVFASNSSSASAYGVAVGGNVFIKDKVKLNITVDPDCDGGLGFELDDPDTNVKISGSAKVTVYAPWGAFYKRGPVYSKKYVPKVKAGDTESKIKVNKKKPKETVYTKYKYVSIKKAK